MEMERTVGKGRILILNKVVGVAGGERKPALPPPTAITQNRSNKLNKQIHKKLLRVCSTLSTALFSSPEST
jgi:hypothetical protein